jgi:DNA uptake protein ComE-like DNA-binding protein
MKKLTATVLAPIMALFLGASARAEETAAAKAGRIDINTATEQQLQDTLGVGADQARKIVEARPYAKRDDLKERNVVPADTFEKIKKLIESVC